MHPFRFALASISLLPVALLLHAQPPATQPTTQPTTQPSAPSPLSQIKLVAGMQRLEAEKLIAEATGTKSTYDLHAMNTTNEVTYRDATTILIVKYKPGAPAPWVRHPDGRAEHLPPTDGEVLSWEFQTKQTAATQPAPAFTIDCKKKTDSVSVTTETDRTLFIVTSPSGMGGATIERKADAWPKQVVLRIRLKGLESLTIASGAHMLYASVLSHSGHPRKINPIIDGKDQPPLTKDSPLWMEILTKDATGKTIDGLPDKDGYFELAIPKSLLNEKTTKLTLNWVDFWR